MTRESTTVTSRKLLASLRAEGRMLRSLALAALICIAPSMGVRALAQQREGAPPVDAGIRDALRQYSTALEQLDADAVKKVQPSIETESLRKAFREMRALSVTIEDVRVLAAEGTVARLSCRVTQALTPKAGSKQTTAVTRVMRLRRQGDSWVIEAFER
jgi:negative regulator of sigma E activity